MKAKYLLLLLLFSCQKQTLERYNNSERRIIVDGNSLAVGQGSSGGGYRTILRSHGYKVINRARVGQTTLDMIIDCSDVDTILQDNDILIVDEASNDIYFGACADTAYAHLERYCNERRFKRIFIILVTPTPRSGHGTPAAFEQTRLQLIAMLRTAHFYDGLADAGSNIMIGMSGEECNRYYYVDSCHHSNPGYQVRGAVIERAIK